MRNKVKNYRILRIGFYFRIPSWGRNLQLRRAFPSDCVQYRNKATTPTKSVFKEARYSYFIPRVMIWKLKIHPKANVRFPPNFTIIITYDHSLIFYWFPSNRGYHSNCYNVLLFLINTDLHWFTCLKGVIDKNQNKQSPPWMVGKWQPKFNQSLACCFRA